MDICKQSVVASPCTIIQQLCRVLCLATSFPETTPIPKSVISGKTCRTNQGTKIVEFKLQQEDGKRINTVRNIRLLVSIYSSDIFAVSVCLFSYLRASGLFRIINRGAGEGLYDFFEKCLLVVGEKVHTETV